MLAERPAKQITRARAVTKRVRHGLEEFALIQHLQAQAKASQEANFSLANNFPTGTECQTRDCGWRQK
jgi:hypothetical protein